MFTTRAYVTLPWNQTEIKTSPQGYPQDVVPLFLIDRELPPQVRLFCIRLLLTALQPIICIGLGTGVLADGLIAISMCWFLYHKRTGWARKVDFPHLRSIFGWTSCIEQIPWSWPWCVTVSTQVCWRGEILSYVDQTQRLTQVALSPPQGLSAWVFPSSYTVLEVPDAVISLQSAPPICYPRHLSGRWLRVRAQLS